VGESQHICDLPGHFHYVKEKYRNCNEEHYDSADYKRFIRSIRLKTGNWQFGHGGSHHGTGTEECPRELHHHCDMFCDEPTKQELRRAGINPKDFRSRSRK
jgi:hypothetical protein